MTQDAHMSAAQGTRVSVSVRNYEVIDGVAFDALSAEGVVAKVRSAWNQSNGGVIVTPNVDIMRLVHHEGHHDLVEKSAVVTPDGMPIIWASWLQGTHLPERVTGVDLVSSLSEAAAQDGHSVYLLGAAPGVAERAASTLASRYAGLKVAGTHSPERGFMDDDAAMQAIIDDLRLTKPSIVFLAFGFPRQEKLAHILHEQFPDTWFLGCGGSFDMICGDLSRAPKVFQKTGTEWIHRMSLEPSRLGPRYLKHDMPFVLGLLGRAVRKRWRSKW